MPALPVGLREESAARSGRRAGRAPPPQRGGADYIVRTWGAACCAPTWLGLVFVGNFWGGDCVVIPVVFQKGMRNAPFGNQKDGRCFLVGSGGGGEGCQESGCACSGRGWGGRWADGGRRRGCARRLRGILSCRLRTMCGR